MHLLDPGTQLLRRFPSHTGQWLSSASLGFLFSPVCTQTLLLKTSTHPPAHPPTPLSIHHSSRHPPIHPPIHPPSVWPGCLALLSKSLRLRAISMSTEASQTSASPGPSSPEREAGIRLCLRAPGASWVPLGFGFKALWVELRRGREKRWHRRGSQKSVCENARDRWVYLGELEATPCFAKMRFPGTHAGSLGGTGFKLFFFGTKINPSSNSTFHDLSEGHSYLVGSSLPKHKAHGKARKP